MSTMQESTAFFNGLIAGVIIMALFAALFVFIEGSPNDVRMDAVKKGHAHYNTQTGAWEWNQPDACGTARVVRGLKLPR